jgi:hypothetical protein
VCSSDLQLSNIGQTYGAVSAILSSLALGGILASLLYQARDTRNAREQTARTLQLELIRMELNDPSLMTAMGAPWDVDIPSESASIREFLYVQLWVSVWGGNYDIGELPESAVRHFAAHELFRGRAGRTYWAAVGQLQIANSKGRRNHFFRLLDEEYKKAISSGVPVASPVKVNDASAQSQTASAIRTKPVQQVCIVAIATIIGTLAGRLWRCKRVQLPPAKYRPQVYWPSLTYLMNESHASVLNLRCGPVVLESRTRTYWLVQAISTQ